jgi:regulatory protein
MQDTYEKAMGQAMTYLGVRARTIKQMEQYLIKKQHDERTIARVMEKLIEYRLLDDEQFAKRYIETRAATNGKYLLRQKMMRQGLDHATIDEAIGEIPFEEQVAAARALLEKKLEHDEREDALHRAVQSVLRRGFSYDAVRAAADQYKEELSWDE